MTTSTKRAPLRVGVIGAGWPGERHAEGYLAYEDAELVAIADLDDTRRAAFARQYNVPQTYADYHDLLANPDIEAVSVALPNFLHRPAVIAALEAGKHVLCEKPPAVTLADAQEMQDTAERKGLLLAYALQRRSTPASQALREKLQEGMLGEVYHARSVWTRTWGVPQGLGGWFTDPTRAGGGALIDIGIHVLDLGWYLMGCPKPRTISGQVYNKFPALTKTDDSAFALIRFDDGHSLQLEASWVLTQDIDQMGVNLYGTRGGAHVDDNKLDLFTVSEEGRVRSSPLMPFGGNLLAFKYQAANFVRAVRGEEPPRTSAQQGVQLMQMIDAIYRSSREGSEVALD